MKPKYPLLSRILIIAIISILAFPVYALDNGYKVKKSKNDINDQSSAAFEEESNNKQPQKNSEKTSYTIPDAESEEDRASWFIEQSIPQSEKESKKKELEAVKASKKIIKKGKKECRKLKQQTKKNERKSFTNSQSQ